MTILGNDSYLRSFLVFKTAVFITKDGQVKTAVDPTPPRTSRPSRSPSSSRRCRPPTG